RVLASSVDMRIEVYWRGGGAQHRARPPRSHNEAVDNETVVPHARIVTSISQGGRRYPYATVDESLIRQQLALSPAERLHAIGQQSAANHRLVEAGARARARQSPYRDPVIAAIAKLGWAWPERIAAAAAAHEKIAELVR